MGEADKERARARKREKKAAEQAAENAKKAAAKSGRKSAAKVPLPRGTKPQPDTNQRNQPCDKALAHKPHGAHRYRSGSQTMHCPGVS